MIELRQLNKYYKVGKQRFHALKDVDLTIGDGEMVAVVGKSGAGKCPTVMPYSRKSS